MVRRLTVPPAEYAAAKGLVAPSRAPAGVQGPAVDGLVLLRFCPAAAQFDRLAELDTRQRPPPDEVVTHRVAYQDGLVISHYAGPESAGVRQPGKAQQADRELDREVVVVGNDDLNHVEDHECDPDPEEDERRFPAEHRLAIGAGFPGRLRLQSARPGRVDGSLGAAGLLVLADRHARVLGTARGRVGVPRSLLLVRRHESYSRLLRNPEPRRSGVCAGQRVPSAAGPDGSSRLPTVCGQAPIGRFRRLAG